MQRLNNEQNKYRTVIAIVLLSFIPFAIFVKNAEGNFRKAQIKNIASKRRDRLDKEHGIDREALQADYQILDKQFRVTEKEEIKKYLEIGKTPSQYFQEQREIRDEFQEQKKLDASDSGL